MIRVCLIWYYSNNNASIDIDNNSDMSPVQLGQFLTIITSLQRLINVGIKILRI